MRDCGRRRGRVWGRGALVSSLASRRLGWSHGQRASHLLSHRGDQSPGTKQVAIRLSQLEDPHADDRHAAPAQQPHRGAVSHPQDAPAPRSAAVWAPPRSRGPTRANASDAARRTCEPFA